MTLQKRTQVITESNVTPIEFVNTEYGKQAITTINNSYRVRATLAGKKFFLQDSAFIVDGSARDDVTNENFEAIAADAIWSYLRSEKIVIA